MTRYTGLATWVRQKTTAIYRRSPFFKRRFDPVWRELAEIRRSAPELNLYFDRTGRQVRAGPFAGMKYDLQATGSQLFPKLLGTYEQIIHPWVTDALQGRYDVLIDIGCAEGYYACGFAFASKVIRVKAIDIDPLARKLCWSLATSNGLTDRVEICHSLSEAFSGVQIHSRPLVLCDVEGAEYVLLDPQVYPGLTRCDIIVELHDWECWGLRKAITKRFRLTHHCELLHDTGVRIFPDTVRGIADELKAAALMEARPAKMQFMRLKCRV